MIKRATDRDLPGHFSEDEAPLNKREEVEIRKRRKVIVRLVPVWPKAEVYPDFTSLRKQIFGDKSVSKTGTDLVSKDRGRY